MSTFDPCFEQVLADAAARNMRRGIGPLAAAAPGRIASAGRELLNFSGNDYLGLARHPLLAERAADWTRRHGAGAQASRLVTGTLDAHAQVEAKLARLKGTEAALLFASGWQLNASVLPALIHGLGARGQVEVYTDKLVHASMHHGCQAAGIRQIRYRHNDLAHLDRLLTDRAAPDVRRLIVTESVFSMDGDRADVPALAALADRHGAFLYLDEAHATGVLGPQGMGLSGLAPGGVDLIMGTFSKALGGFGAYVAGSQALCDFLVNTCSGFIYSTGLPPSVLGAMDAALDLVPGMDADRAHLSRLAARLRDGLQAQGRDTGASSTQIVPAMVGDAGDAVALSARLKVAGMLAVAIRPPTVPAGTSRLRIALSAAHTVDDVDCLLDALARDPMRGAA
ncbi:aminotransferase class I/II-fold pyridoxal phosphate-dependent enzyme [Pigmentiphaga litoralis]|uniref:aminotransferase class I/II-fold pyridoxal phosphate-dependent enzyme n=1 Tax=Pigmentiphaga litoralis TaxID=516702 RepID=UPI003B429154